MSAIGSLSLLSSRIIRDLLRFFGAGSGVILSAIPHKSLNSYSGLRYWETHSLFEFACLFIWGWARRKFPRKHEAFAARSFYDLNYLRISSNSCLIAKLIIPIFGIRRRVKTFRRHCLILKSLFIFERLLLDIAQRSVRLNHSSSRDIGWKFILV